jgi:hypothetical protein
MTFTIRHLESAPQLGTCRTVQNRTWPSTHYPINPRPALFLAMPSSILCFVVFFFEWNELFVRRGEARVGGHQLEDQQLGIVVRMEFNMTV